MADIIDKIGKYFAEQEAQNREMYARAAVSAAVEPPVRRASVKTPQQPAKESQSKPPSLLRRRLSITSALTTDKQTAQKQSKQEDDAVVFKRRSSWAAGAPFTREASPNRTHEDESNQLSVMATPPTDTSSEAASDVVSSTSSKPTARSVVVKKKKKKKKTERPKHDVDQEQLKKQAAQRATEGLLRAQERARRIQMEKVMEEKQQQLEREANIAKLQDEMRKIEEIRQRGRQFAVRLRPQSAPSTPKSVQQSHESPTPISARTSGFAMEAASQSMVNRRIIDEDEREVAQQMQLELMVNERVFKKHERGEIEWNRLHTQLKKTGDRNAIKQERVKNLVETKRALEKQIADAQNEIHMTRSERHRLEEKARRERQQKLRGAEREIQARLRREESQRLIDEERKQVDEAAEARHKAKQRVQSRAALLKKVLHGFDIRPDDPGASKSTNQEVADRISQPSPAILDVVGPELAEFEEDGLSPEEHSGPAATETGSVSTGRFVWQVPAISLSEIHKIILEELLDLSDSDDEGKHDLR